MSWTIEDKTLSIVTSEECTRGDDGVKTLTLSGCLYVAGQDKEYLVTNLVTPILGYVSIVEVFPIEGNYPILVVLQGQESTIASPSGRYNGEWILTNADFRAVSTDNKDAFEFTLTLIQGSSHEVL